MMISIFWFHTGGLTNILLINLSISIPNKFDKSKENGQIIYRRSYRCSATKRCSTVFFFWFSFFVNGISLFLKTISYLEFVPTLMIDDAETKMRSEASLLFELKTSVPFCQALQICELI
jgi:hypothetical protein